MAVELESADPEDGQRAGHWVQQGVGEDAIAVKLADPGRRESKLFDRPVAEDGAADPAAAQTRLFTIKK